MSRMTKAIIAGYYYEVEVIIIVIMMSAPPTIIMTMWRFKLNPRRKIVKILQGRNVVRYGVHNPKIQSSCQFRTG